MLYEVITYTNSATMFIFAFAALSLNTFVLRNFFNCNDEDSKKRLIGNIFIFMAFSRITSYNVCYTKLLRPTAPFISVQLLNEAFNKLKNDKLDSVFPIVSFGYPIQRSLKMDKDKVCMVNPEFMNSRSQDLEKRYHDAGQFYFLDTKKFLEKNKLFTDNSGAIIIDELQVQDIDNEVDWKLAELKYKLLNDQN